MKMDSRVAVVLIVGMAIVFAAPGASAQFSFNHAGFATGGGPTAVILADFNGDHRPDLAVANSFDGTVSILVGRADGSFAPKVDYATGTLPVALVAADFNGDGKLDLAGRESEHEQCLYSSGEWRRHVPESR
jgi:hypothetical protein